MIAGPTASGKTTLSLRIAEALAKDGVPVEIISADSRQVYRGMDIGTAKVTAAQRERVPHHGLDLVDPDEAFSVADYTRHVRTVLAGMGTRGVLPILVGGTGLYLRSAVRGLPVDDLPSDTEERARLEAELVRDGLAATAARLREVAPRLAAATDTRNPRRVVRALEIALLGGDRERPAFNGYPGPVSWIGPVSGTEDLRSRIASRAAAQFAGGLIEEAEGLRARFGPDARAFSAFGYAEAFDVLDDRLNLTDAIDVDTNRTLAFARRQRTWFRSEPGIEWIPTGAGHPDALSSALVVARRLAERREQAGRPSVVGR